MIPGLGRSPGEGKGYPLQYSGLENSMDCMVHGITKSQKRLSGPYYMYQRQKGVKRTNYLTSNSCILDGWTRNKEKKIHDMISVSGSCFVNVMEQPRYKLLIYIISQTSVCIQIIWDPFKMQFMIQQLQGGGQKYACLINCWSEDNSLELQDIISFLCSQFD